MHLREPRCTPGVAARGSFGRSATCSSGALPTLRAATDPAVQGGQYYGPDGVAGQRGNPKLINSSAQSHDEDLQRRLWTVCEELTGVSFGV